MADESFDGDKYFTEFISKHPKLIPASEGISVLILVIGLILNYFEIKNSDIILITGAFLTAITYFLSTFQIVETGDPQISGILNSAGFNNFIYKLYYLALCIAAIVIIGFVIKTLHFLKLLSAVSLISLSIVLIFSIITKLSNRSAIYNSVFYVRIVPAILLLIYILKYNPQ